MSKRAIKIEDIDCGKNEKGNKKILRIEVSYRMGGINYFTGTSTSRGYYLSAQPYTVEDYDGYQMESMIGFTGLVDLMQEASRFGQKKLETIADEVIEGKHEELVERLKEAVKINCITRMPSFFADEKVEEPA